MANPIKDMTGLRCGRLSVIRLAGITRDGAASWLCQCDCGNTTAASGRRLRAGQTTSCGCFQKERVAARSIRHGMEGTKVYHAWRSMRYRCERPQAKMWANYGGRGIRVCQEWASFEQFYADMGAPPTSAHSLDRVNNDGNYEKANCRWALSEVQNGNRRTSVLITHEGQTLTLAGWARVLGLKSSTVKSRHYAGWVPPRLFRTTETGLSTP